LSIFPAGLLRTHRISRNTHNHNGLCRWSQIRKPRPVVVPGTPLRAAAIPAARPLVAALWGEGTISRERAAWETAVILRDCPCHIWRIG
jgi:hypothetical protein